MGNIFDKFYWFLILYSVKFTWLAVEHDKKKTDILLKNTMKNILWRNHETIKNGPPRIWPKHLGSRYGQKNMRDIFSFKFVRKQCIWNLLKSN